MFILFFCCELSLNEFLFGFEGGVDIFEYDWLNTLSQFDNVVLLGFLIYTDYILTFLSSGFILLVAMIGTIMLTLHHSYQVRRQEIYKQVGRNSVLSLRFKYNIVQK